MLYALVRPLARIGISVYFKKIYLSNVDRIPKDKPVILACNHPTAFLEPCILACFLDRPLYYLVRGDFFKKTINNFLLRALHMLPIYRKKDGNYKALKANYATFDACYDALKANRTLMIFPEGHAVAEYRLRPLHKGLGKIAMGIFEKYPDIEDVYVIPVGVNYSNVFQFRSEVMIDFGIPINARSYYEQHKEQPVHGVNAILNDLSEAMKEQMIIVGEPSHDVLGNQMLELNRSRFSEASASVLSDDRSLLQGQQAIANAVSELDNEERVALEKAVERYHIGLLKHGVTDKALYGGEKPISKLYLRWAAWSLPAGLGILLNRALINYLEKTVQKKARRTEYYPPMLIAFGIAVYLLLTLVFLLLAILISPWLLLFIPIMLGSAYAWMRFRAYTHELLQEQQRRKIPPARMEALLKQRSELLSKLLSYSS